MSNIYDSRPSTECNFDKAAARISMLKFFPTHRDAISELAEILREMCSDKEALDWLVSEVMTKLTDWPGPAGIRSILCGKFRPRDGAFSYLDVPGYRRTGSDYPLMDDSWKGTK